MSKITFLFILAIISSSATVNALDVFHFDHSPCKPSGFFGMGEPPEYTFTNFDPDAPRGIDWDGNPIIVRLSSQEIIVLNETFGSYLGNDSIDAVWSCTNDQHESTVWIPEFSDMTLGIALAGSGLLFWRIRKFKN